MSYVFTHATLLDGTTVAVKVRRPGVAESMAEDIMLMKHLLALGEFASNSHRSILLSLEGFVEEIERTTASEVNFTSELHNLMRFHDELADERLALLDKEYNHCRRQLQLVLASNPNPQQRATAEYRLGEVEEASGDVVEASKHYAYAALHGGTLAVQSEAETKLVGASTAGEATGAGITMAMPRLVIEDVPPEDAL